MILFLVLIVIVLIGLATAAVMGKISGFMADPTSSQSFGGVPPGPLSSDEIAHLHFDQALRGYRMDQVDEVIDALIARVRELEAPLASSSALVPPALVPPALVPPALVSPADVAAPATPADPAIAESDSRGSSGEPQK